MREIFKESVKFAEKHLEEMQGGKIPKIFESRPKVNAVHQFLESRREDGEMLIY